MTTIAFTRAIGPVSWLIRKFTGGEVSHAAFTTVIHGVPIAIHAAVGGVQVTHARDFLRGRVVVDAYRPLLRVEEALSTAIKAVGEPYDYPGILGYFPATFARWLGLKVRNPFGSPRAVVCSEFVLRTIVEAGIAPELSELDPEVTNPFILQQVCSKARTLVRVSPSDVWNTAMELPVVK